LGKVCTLFSHASQSTNHDKKVHNTGAVHDEATGNDDHNDDEVDGVVETSS
jgi:hypothetical protein